MSRESVNNNFRFSKPNSLSNSTLNNEVSMEELQQTIYELQNIIFQKDVEILEKDEEISFLKNESIAMDKLLGYEPNMSYDEKVKYNEEAEKELEEAELNLDISTKRKYDSDMEKEDRLIECALGINELQFDVAELFKTLKTNIDNTKYEEYKKHKRAFYAMIDFFYTNYTGEERIDIFDLLIEMLEKEKGVYELDEEIKNIK
jgi:hypothetical protein